jgi:uncharacterized RDD family membrane protein YckC
MSSATEAVVFQFRCPRCYVALLATTERIGEPFVCPDCGTTSQVPEATPNRIAAAHGAQSSTANAPASPAPAKSKPAPSTSVEADYRAAYRQFRDETGIVASPLTRLVARLIDGACLLAAAFLGFILLGVLIAVLKLSIPTEPDPLTLAVFLGIGFGPAAILMIGQWAWTANEGRTIGKKLMGIRIARRCDDLQPGFLQGVVLRSWINYLLGTIIPFYSGADVLYIFSHDGRCLHDRLAGTIVLEGNVPRTSAGQR